MHSSLRFRSLALRILLISLLAVETIQADPPYIYQAREADVLNIDIALQGSLVDLSKLTISMPLQIVGESVFSHHTVTVTPDGQLYLPGIPPLKVTGMTLPQIEQAIASGLGLPANRNYVSVALVSTNSLVFYVWGEVKQPGRYPLDHPTSLMEALSEAGGPTENAQIKNVAVIRRDQKTLKVNLSLRQMRVNGPSEVMLKPYDTVYVPRKWSPSEFFVFALLTAVTAASSAYVASKAR